MSRQELIDAFTLERCLRGPSQMDLQKLTNLNGQYIAELPAEQFQALAKKQLSALPWADQVASPLFEQVALFMQSRVKRLVDVAQWEYFFTEYPTWDSAVCEKLLGKNPAAKSALATLVEPFAELPEWTASAIEQAVERAAESAGIPHGKLNQPLRAAVTGTNIGAGIFETLELIGRERTIKRLEKISTIC